MEDCVAEDVEVTSIVGLVTGVVVTAEKSGTVGLEAVDAQKALPQQKMRQGQVLEAHRRRCRGRYLGKSPVVAESMAGVFGEEVGDDLKIAYGKVCSSEVT
jgi:hypothetical protein